MKRSEYVDGKNESEGRSAKKRALRRCGEFKLAKRGKEGGKLGEMMEKDGRLLMNVPPN